MNIDINSGVILNKIDDRSARIGIVGFGYIGTILGAIIAESGFHVLGIDIDADHLERLQKGDSEISEPGLGNLLKSQLESQRLELSTEFSMLQDCDIIVVSVSTPVGADHNSDLSNFTDALEQMSPYISDRQVVIIKSTVPPLTTENLAFDKLFGDNYSRESVLYAFCPERIALGNAIAEFRSIPIIVGGMNPQSSKCVSAFFKASLGVDSMETSLPRTAEMVKLADNLWIDLNIAMANELAMLSDSLDIDVLEIIQASNTLDKGSGHVNILMPSVGVGGSCLPKDPHFLVEFGKKMGVDLKTPQISRQVNDAMPAYSVGRIIRALKNSGTDINGARIAVLGIAYKNNTGDCRKSPAGPFIELLKSKGAEIKVHDPNVTEVEARTVTDIALSDCLAETIKGADCVAFLAGHNQFNDITVAQMSDGLHPGAVVFDGRMYFPKRMIKEFKEAGLNYIGVGR